MTNYVNTVLKPSIAKVFLKQNWTDSWEYDSSLICESVSLHTIHDGVDECSFSRKFGLLANPDERNVSYHAKYDILSAWVKVEYDETVIFMGRLTNTRTKVEGLVNGQQYGEQTFSALGGMYYLARIAIWKYLYANPTVNLTTSNNSLSIKSTVTGWGKKIVDYSPGYNTTILIRDALGGVRSAINMGKGIDGDNDAVYMVAENVDLVTSVSNVFPQGNDVDDMFKYITKLFTELDTFDETKPSVSYNLDLLDSDTKEQVIEYKPQPVDNLANFCKAFLNPEYGMDAVLLPTTNGYELYAVTKDHYEYTPAYIANNVQISEMEYEMDVTNVYGKVTLVGERESIQHYIVGAYHKNRESYPEFRFRYSPNDETIVEHTDESNNVVSEIRNVPIRQIQNSGRVTTTFDDTTGANEGSFTYSNDRTEGDIFYGGCNVCSTLLDQHKNEVSGVIAGIDVNGVNQEYTAQTMDIGGAEQVGIGYSPLNTGLGVEFTCKPQLAMATARRNNLNALPSAYVDSLGNETILSSYYNSSEGVNIYSYPADAYTEEETPPSLSIDTAIIQYREETPYRTSYTKDTESDITSDELVLYEPNAKLIYNITPFTHNITLLKNTFSQYIVSTNERAERSVSQVRFSGSVTYHGILNGSTALGHYVTFDTNKTAYCSSLTWNFTDGGNTTVLNFSYE